MSYALVAHDGAGSATSNNVTTPGKTTTGTDLILVFVSKQQDAVDPGVSDSKGNTYTKRGAYLVSSVDEIQLWECDNPTSVGAGHTVTVTTSSAFPSVAVLFLSGSAASAFDQKTGNSINSGTTLQPGSLTPSEGNCIVVTALASNQAGPSVNSPFSPPVEDIAFTSGQHYGVAVAYEIQTSATARNPQWSFGSAANMAAILASYKAAAGGGGSPPTVSSITPSSGIVNADSDVIYEDVTITGTNLTGGSISVSGSGVSASNVVVVNSTTITLSLKITAAASLGGRTVTVTTADGSAGVTFSVNSASGGSVARPLIGGGLIQ